MRWRARRALGAALQRHGLTADDIGVVSKHDTSTEMNDPSEADLHDRLQDALGRTPGNPLLVVSQKTVTGHAKGGAAAWQLDGVLRMLETGAVPGNRNLETVDPLERGNAPPRARRPPDPARRAAARRADRLARLRPRLRGPAVAHPDTFLAAFRNERDDYLRRAGRRRAEGARRRLRDAARRPAPVRRDRTLAPRRRGGDAARR